MGRKRKYGSISEANRIGGLARAAALTPERRSEIAEGAAAARVRPGRKKVRKATDDEVGGEKS